jgi:hypothetical protein
MSTLELKSIMLFSLGGLWFASYFILRLETSLNHPQMQATQANHKWLHACFLILMVNLLLDLKNDNFTLNCFQNLVGAFSFMLFTHHTSAQQYSFWNIKRNSLVGSALVICLAIGAAMARLQLYYVCLIFAALIFRRQCRLTSLHWSNALGNLEALTSKLLTHNSALDNKRLEQHAHDSGDKRRKAG